MSSLCLSVFVSVVLCLSWFSFLSSFMYFFLCFVIYVFISLFISLSLPLCVYDLPFYCARPFCLSFCVFRYLLIYLFRYFSRSVFLVYWLMYVVLPWLPSFCLCVLIPAFLSAFLPLCISFFIHWFVFLHSVFIDLLICSCVPSGFLPWYMSFVVSGCI